MLSTQIKTPSDLKHFHEENHPNSQFFKRKTMQFFGDTVANWGVRRVQIVQRSGAKAEAFELFRKRPVKNGLRSSNYFCSTTFRVLHNVQGVDDA